VPEVDAITLKITYKSTSHLSRTKNR